MQTSCYFILFTAGRPLNLFNYKGKLMLQPTLLSSVSSSGNGFMPFQSLLQIFHINSLNLFFSDTQAKYKQGQTFFQALLHLIQVVKILVSFLVFLDGWIPQPCNYFFLDNRKICVSEPRRGGRSADTLYQRNRGSYLGSVTEYEHTSGKLLHM